MKEIKNIAASIRARLLNISKEKRIDFNRTLLLYAQERFIYRLMKSEYCNNFVFKGGIMFYAVHKLNARPTKDIDLLAQNIQNTAFIIKQITKDIISIKSDDGLLFDSNSVEIEDIAEGKDYSGFRAKFNAYLEKAKISLQIDLGFNDIIYPQKVKFQYPTIFNSKKIIINFYSWESVIAEKFEAIVKLGDLNSRMKDFYDICFIMENNNFNGQVLKEAIIKTFNRRKTNLANYSFIFLPDYYNSREKQLQWEAFRRKTNLDIKLSFSETVIFMGKFLRIVMKAAENKQLFGKYWKYSELKWIDP